VNDWGIVESLNQFLTRHEILWEQIDSLGAPVGDFRKKMFLIESIEGATGSQGPYQLTLDAASETPVTYDAAKRLFLLKEPTVIARSGVPNSNKCNAAGEQSCNDRWLPYDGVKRKGKWVYDESTASKYMDPLSISASTAMAYSATASSKTGGTQKGNQGRSGGGTRSESNTTKCALCNKEGHRTKDCKKGYICAKCGNWRHLVGTPCDGGKAKAEYYSKRGGTTKKAASAEANLAQGGPLPKAPDAAPAAAPSSMTAAFSSFMSTQTKATERLTEAVTSLASSVSSAPNERPTSAARTSSTASQMKRMTTTTNGTSEVKGRQKLPPYLHQIPAMRFVALPRRR
jgi:hypothetical protein